MINTEAHKRKLVPDRSDYTCFTKIVNGKYVLKNSNGNVLYTFKDEEDCKLKANAIGEALYSVYRLKQIDYETHLRNYPQYYVQTYEEANWIHRALYKGFKIVGNDEINPYHNWFGCSLYSPDRVLQKDKKFIKLSLQGIVTRVNYQVSEKYKELFENRAIRYLVFIDNEKIVYETWTGELPSNDFIEDFINN